MIIVRAEVIGENPASFIVRQTKDMGTPSLEWLAMKRTLTKEEFSNSYWLRPDGGTFQWPRTEAFGDFPAPSSPLRRTDSLLRALLGEGAGSIELIRNDIGQFSTGARGVTVEFGASGNVFPHIEVHRGGIGEEITLSPHVRTVTPKQRAFLHYHGIHLRRETVSLTTPRRPFLTDSPKARERTARIFTRHILGQSLSEGI